MNGQRKGLEHRDYIQKLANHYILKEVQTNGFPETIDTKYYLMRALAHHCERLRKGLGEVPNID